MAVAGEPFLSFFSPIELQKLLKELGFARIVDFDLPAILKQLFGERAIDAPVARRGGHVLFAYTA